MALEKKKKYKIPGWQWIIATVTFFIAVQKYQQYILFDIEQTRVFVYESDKMLSQLMRAGGISDFIALFLQQFFILKWVGPAIMAVVFGLLSFIIHKVYQHAAGRKTSLTEDILCCLPAALLFVYTEGKIFFITGHIAILLSSLALLIGVLLVNWKNIAALCLLPLLIILAGFACSTAVWPMIISLFLYSLLYRKKLIAAVIIVLSALLMIGLARYLCLAVNSTELFLPDIFTFRLKSETIMLWVWVSIVVVTVMPFIIDKFIPEKLVMNSYAASFIAGAVFGITHQAYNTHHDESTLQRLQLQHWIDTGNYADAYEFCAQNINNAYTSNIYFMIISMGGELENEVGGMLRAPQQLFMKPSQVRFVRRLFMSLYYYIGYVNGAQREAFEYNEPTDGMMIPAAVKILAQTNLCQGNYAVAEKYLNYLEHTLFYRDWAKQYRRFLYNDKAVEEDAELGPRRKTLTMESVPERWTTRPHIIRQIANTAPELPASNYYKAFKLLGAYNTEQ
ncbi:MAG: hypothetical protein HUK05_05420 [Prevotella sp.]|nr:hypothetical protein [Prevotella sp.]